MEPNNNFSKVFGKLPIISMIHLAGKNPVSQTLEEVSLLADEGLDGVIVENYHGTIDNVQGALEALATKRYNMAIGVNILPNDFAAAFTLARLYNANFIQLDFVAGKYQQGPRLNKNSYDDFKSQKPNMIVLGGVWPKYYTPILGSKLEDDLKEGMQKAEAIVVTGEGTGIETPIEKVKEFRRILGIHPLIIGAGLSPQNAREQLLIADGAIVGSYFKEDNRTENPLNPKRIRELMSVVNEVRVQKYS